MSYEKVKQAKQLIIGVKQTRKAIERQMVSFVALAKDADLILTHPIQTLCEQKDVAYSYVSSMKDLGKASGIQVGTAAVAILKD
ncbi:ribosomal L7Ae/L30e/S12e/Gadd45 family protein [Shimazuella kribbensis]|uniref:ribosomal L7Ae/L30e/S12e/Gadd45 family protein n=1 Tax=Shimazuella kribbensis TaxID=139808 RepID=UPI000404F699|nr:ribosomal L7Ae/L30e/S12e/Gadd45 family protein [Shimazuella kribbensis]